MTNRVAATDSPKANAAVRRLGFWSAVLTAVFAAAFFAVGIATPVRSIPYPNVASFIPNDYLWMYPALLLAPTFVVLVGASTPTRSMTGRYSVRSPSHSRWSMRP